MDKFRVETIAATPNPQQLVWAAMHQDYSEDFVWDKKDKFPDEAKAGELIVKHLLAGNRGHYGCYSADTEVLTKRGWIAWKEILKEDRLLAVDIKNKESHFEKPQAVQKVKFQAEDKLYTVKSQYLDLKVTLDHRMVVSHRQKSGGFSEWYFKPASEIYQKPVRYLLNSHLSSKERKFPADIPLDFDLLTVFKIAGFFFGDGMRSKNKEPGVIRFKLRRPRKIAYLLSLGFPISQTVGDRYVIRSKPLAAWIHQHFSTEEGKCIPRWILTLPENAIAAFWDGLKNSDGTRVTKKSWAFDSCEKTALDLLQATAHINGFSANLTLNNPNRGEEHQNHRPCWRLNISERSTRRSESNQKNRTPGIVESLTDYDGYVYCASVSTGALLVRRNGKVVVCGNCIEHPQITLNVGYFPHSMMQQIRTHRVGVSFDVQSFRYTGSRIIDVVEGKRDVEDVFYLRPVDNYTNRQGKRYLYSEEQRQQDIKWCIKACKIYQQRISEGLSEEHARSLIPFDARQNFVMSCNARSLMHLLDLRWKKDAQLEAQKLCELLYVHFEAWMPTLAHWYLENRAKKARLSP